MAPEHNLEKQIHKQMGCMAGFLHIFDRHHILNGKRIYSTKRLTSLPVVDTTSDSEKSPPESPAISKELAKTSPERSRQTTAAVAEAAALRSPEAVVVDLPPKSPLTFESKEEIRTSDSILSVVANRCDRVESETMTNGGGQQSRSPSVIARLMGLEALPKSSDSTPDKEPELRRSASESRVSRDLFNSRFVADATNLYPKQPTQSPSALFNNAGKDNSSFNPHYADPNANKAEQVIGLNRGGSNSSSPWRAPQQHRRSFFDSVDVFPEPKQTVSIYGEIEKRLRMRGIDEPSQDLDTLKQILEALQLKGLLHSKQPPQDNQIRHRNFVYDESPIVIMKPSRSPLSTPSNRRIGNDYHSSSSWSNGVNQIRRYYSLAGEHSPPASPQRERNVGSPTRTGRGSCPTTRNEGAKRSNSVVNSKPLSVVTQRRVNNKSTENRRVSPVHSRKYPTVDNRSPRNKKSTAGIHQKEKITTMVAAEDESSSISGSSITTSTDTERWKAEEYKEGRNLLERCDKLLHSISEMGATGTQPSPVSVLDSSFYKDDSLTPSPVTTKRNIDFKDLSGEFEEETWSPMISPIRSKRVEIIDDCDFVYISDILRESHSLPEDSDSDLDLFLLLERQQYIKGHDTSKVSRLQRKLIFDTINEILERNRQLPPWKAVLWGQYDMVKPPLEKVWLEFQRIRERENAEDLFEIICGVLKKDLAGDAINGWGDCSITMSEAVLDIERLIFKDLIGDAIRDLVELASRCTLSYTMPRRKLVF
ncbi:hypothetical protein BUALT_Bualt13G0015100 [Buddleja alternifolia]|uniref:DUF4378 domain-containing protein n=1 Tax=Buddleja alternifolia TaxID=168488 RepID=A0AAV6WRN7_9LAMI|nr:hypothetical protein BUALT_Bualt13G0015100 [Buddleja alternifolia]